MKTYIILLFTLISLASFSQKNEKKFAKLKALKTGYISNELDLSSKEAEKFWPIYNKYEEDFIRLRKKSIAWRKTNFEALSENDAKQLLEQSFEAEEQLHKNRKDLFKALTPVLSYQKLLALKKAEQSFKRKLLNQLKGKKKQ